MKNELNKRIESLNAQLQQKKQIVESELFQIENICKELISLNEKLTKLNSDE